MFTGFVAIFIFPTVKDGIIPQPVIFVNIQFHFSKTYMNLYDARREFDS